MPAPLRCPIITIPAGATGLSGVVYIGPAEIIGYQIGPDWATADISLQASADGVTFAEVFDSAGTVYSTKAVASQYMHFATPLKIGPYIKIRSGTSGSPVNQTTPATITLVLRALPGFGNV
jgi:hypothetical protein